MKVVIPAKRKSMRVTDKNFRNFYQNSSLIDILLDKLLLLFKPCDIYLSSDDEEIQNYCSEKKINFIYRNNYYCNNDTPMSEVINYICGKIPGDDEILWCLCTDPLFNKYEDVIEKWDQVKMVHDSLVVLYERKVYCLNSDFTYINFDTGLNHVPTQEVKPIYQLNNTLFIAKRSVINSENYYFSSNNNYWYIDKDFSIDIDTEEDFKIAQLIYEKKNSIIG
ncbi:hypothetical protein V2O93_04940 [Streptococcus pneumoniae]|nr:hypothetical protein [Streptococcus pneumoniae]HEU3701986.1 hypothetical protein [Streptococcus pneumoniae]